MHLRVILTQPAAVNNLHKLRLFLASFLWTMRKIHNEIYEILKFHRKCMKNKQIYHLLTTKGTVIGSIQLNFN